MTEIFQPYLCLNKKLNLKQSWKNAKLKDMSSVFNTKNIKLVLCNKSSEGQKHKT